MQFIIETISGRKGIKNFNSMDEYVNFMTKNADKIKTIVESEMPYDDKPVKLPKVSTSKGWDTVDSSTFGDIDLDGEKGDCLLPQDNQGVFKNNAQFEPSKSSEKADKVEEPKVEQSPVKTSENGSEKDFKEFKYEDSDKSESKPSEKSSDNKEDKEDKEDSDKKEEKQVNESIFDKGLKGNDLNEAINEYFIYVFMDIFNLVQYENNQSYKQIVNNLIKTDKKMKPFVEKVRNWIANNTGRNERPIDTCQRFIDIMVKNGVDKSIIDSAFEQFKKEELNNNKNSNNFISEIKETLRLAGVQLNEMEDTILEIDDDDEERYGTCQWCGEEYPLSELRKEQDLGLLCNHCIYGIESREGPLNFEDDYMEEQAHNEQDGTVDEKTGKTKLFEEEPKEKSYEDMEPSEQLEYAKKQVRVYEEEKMMAEYDDFAYTNGHMKRVEANLNDWKQEVKRLEKLVDDESIDENCETLEETKPARYNQHLGKDKSFANISASRSNDEFEKPGMEKEKQKQSESNNKKTAQLKKDIKDLGLSYIKTYGAWRDEGPVTQEDSFLIPNITKEQALELGKKYGQYSVIFKEEGDDNAYMYITLDNEDFGKKDMTFDMGDKAKFTQVKKGKDELDPYSGYTGLKPGGKGYNLSYKVKEED